MRNPECRREAELLDALQTTAWPDCCAAGLRAHVDACESCGTLVEIVAPLLDEHRAATAEARVPTSAIVWWRAQTRARQEAARAAVRPIAIWQWLSLACAAGLAAAAIGYLSPAAGAWWRIVRHSVLDLGALARPEAASIPWAEILFTPAGAAAAIGLMMALILAPLALYISD